jgi:hypothetical protein
MATGYHTDFQLLLLIEFFGFIKDLKEFRHVKKINPVVQTDSFEPL